MKKLFVFFTGLILAIQGLNAQIDTEDVGSQNITPVTEESNNPFRIKFEADFIGEAKFRKCYDSHRLRFATGEAQLSFIYYYDPCYREGTNIALSYQRTYLDWKFNPYFNEKNYDNILLLLGGFTERVSDWQWRGQLSINFNNIPNFNINDYVDYDFLLWGRFNYCENLGLHIGFYAQTGMKIDRVYPIIGVDWQYNPDWKINLIFPMNISAIYTFNSAWSIALAGRFFDERNRVKHDEYLSEGLWHYQTTGGEVGINYTPTTWISANVHAGTTFGGHITIADRHYRHRHRYRLDPAPYAGGEVAISF